MLLFRRFHLNRPIFGSCNILIVQIIHFSRNKRIQLGRKKLTFPKHNNPVFLLSDMKDHIKLITFSQATRGLQSFVSALEPIFIFLEGSYCDVNFNNMTRFHIVTYSCTDSLVFVKLLFSLKVTIF